MTITSDQIPGILDLHRKWIFGQDGGRRANLSGADLSGADLSGANLSRANLSRANLSGADLSGANLSRANLSRAYLSGADLSCADLSGADLSCANLSRANLSCADLSGADLSGAYLSCAYLIGAVYAWSQIAFIGHGECGRMLTAIRRKDGDAPELFCGCFSGNTKALRAYIAKGPPELRRTRTLALDTVLMLLDVRNDIAKDGSK